jgi:hypothetical protein
VDTGCNSQPDPSEEKRHAFRDEGSRNEEPKSAPCAASDSITAAGLLFAAMDLLGSLVGLSNPFDKTSFNDALRRQVPVRPEAGQGCSAVVCRASADASSGSQAAARCAVWARYVAARLCGILPGHKVLGLI